MLVSSLLFLRGKKNYHRGILYYLFCLSFVVNIGLLRQPERNLVISSLDLKLSSNARVSLLAKPWLRRRGPNTLSRQFNQKFWRLFHIWMVCFGILSLFFRITLYQNNIKTASFFLHNVFDRNLLSNIMCSKMHRYTVKLYWKDTVAAAAATRLRVCVYRKVFSPI